MSDAQASRLPEDFSVLHVNTNSNWGGGENQVYHLVKGLVEEGVRCTLAAPGEAPLFARAKEAGVPVFPLEENTFGGRRALKRQVRARAPSLLHLHDSGAINRAAGIARGERIPVLFSRRVASPLRKNPFSRRKYAPRNLTAVLAISETVKSAMIASGYPAERIHIAPSGLRFDTLDAVAPAPELTGKQGGRFLVGGLGTLSHKKNWELLIRVAAEPALRPLDIHWVVAGKGPLEYNLKVVAEDLGVADRIHFLGFRDDPLRVLRSLDALFFPSLMEGASVTVREAMAMGVPVIIRDTPGCVESLGGHGWIVSEADLGEAAEIVKHVLLEPEKVREVSEAARRSARERFSFANTVARTLDAYAAVLAR